MSHSVIAVALLLPLAFCLKQDDSSASHPKMTLAVVGKNDEASHPKMTLAVVGKNAEAVAGMATVFDRSEAVHHQSMDSISKTLTTPQAIDALEHGAFANSAPLKQITSFLSGNQNLRSQHDGFGGLDGARRLINDMVHESMTKYDAEIAKCTDYYSKQCALMDVARGQISAANFAAASSRGLILDAQYNIGKTSKSIPGTKQELVDSNLKCKDELHRLNKRLKIIMGDIAVMTMILKMSDCDKKLLQMDKLAMLRCEDQCTEKKTVTFNQKHLQEQVSQLKSPMSKDLIAEAFEELFADGEATSSTELVQVQGSEYQEFVKPKKGPKKGPIDDMPKKGKKLKFNNPPVPRTKVPSNPCTDKNGGAPSAATKRAAKCTLKKSPQCYKLQGRFLQIQAGIADSRDELMDQIGKLESTCEEMKKSLEASIQGDEDLLSSSQTKLAAATEKEAAAGESGRQVAKENTQYNNDLLKQMKTCNGNYIDFETELCALKKIRGDLFKKMKKGHKGFFQDCEVTKWTPEACTKKCAGGVQRVVRSVLTHPGPKGGAGAKCLPLVAKRRCNLGPCPIDCKLHSWTGWSKCSAKCGGGVQQRVRDVKVPMRYNGQPCGETSQTKACHIAACSKDCKLHPWTKWAACSKDCDGGTKKRMRAVKAAAEGSGKCAGEWTKKRLLYKKCNMKSCRVPDPKKVMKCDQSLDIILLLDGTPKSGKAGWAAQVKGANLLVDAFTGKASRAKPNFAVIHYTGPRTWSGVSKCTGKSNKKVDMEKTCKVKIATHFSMNMPKVKSVINGLQFTPGSKLLSLALMTTMAELALGRAKRRTVVVVFMDGEPLSYRKTLLASQTLRKKARLVYVPVTKFSPLKFVKTWASRRWQENIVSVSSADHWAKAETGTHIIANICPGKPQKVVKKRKRRAYKKRSLK